ncbi:MAG: YdcF family protein [Deltaproteobacteria bacterium]|nr:YdcF family protein [Deltaproteobacteria bacterium]
MFTLTYVAKNVLMPAGIIFLLLLLTVVLTLARRRRAALGIGGLAVFLYYVLSISPVANGLLQPLEKLYPPLSGARLPRSATLVVLGGGVSAAGDLPAASRLSNATLQRLLEAVRLYRKMDHAMFVLCGGRANPFNRVAEAELMRQFLLQMAIPASQIVVDEGSRNTVENAIAVQNLQVERPLILVTSASHMPRAMRVFTAQGMKPLAAPCDYRRWDSGKDPLQYWPSVRALAASTHAVYEYFATWWYRISGKV